MKVRTQTLVLVLALTLLITALDQGVKRLVTGTLLLGESRPLIHGLVDCTYQRNTGVAFSQFKDAPMLVLLSINVLMVILFALVVAPYWQKWSGKLAAILVWGGALGNIIDRAFRGYVVDYIDFHFWPVFNFADACVLLGVAALIVAMLPELLPSRREPPAVAGEKHA